jgi:hypothetical protein
LTSRRKQFALAQPVFTYFRNIDVQKLTVKRLQFDRSFEAIDALSLADADLIDILPGDSILVNGFRELIWFEDSGIALGMISTLPLAAYESPYDIETGERIGLFSTDMRLSSVEVALRTFAAAGWAGATDLAEAFSSHAIREMRWGALNYFWRTGSQDLSLWLERFSGDADPQVAALARACVAQMASAGPVEAGG